MTDSKEMKKTYYRLLREQRIMGLIGLIISIVFLFMGGLGVTIIIAPISIVLLKTKSIWICDTKRRRG